MSDFGALISITKTNAGAFSKQEMQNICKICKQIKASNTLLNALSEPYLFEFGKTKAIQTDDCFEINILLSNHWGDASYFDWYRKVELKDMQIITKSIAALLSKNYILNQKFEWW